MNSHMVLINAPVVKLFEADDAFKSTRLCVLIVYVVLVFRFNTICEMCISFFSTADDNEGEIEWSQRLSDAGSSTN